MHMIAIANHCQKWLLTKMCMVNSFFEILCITSNTTLDSLVQLMWPMSLLLFKIKFKSQMLRFFLNLHGLLVKHCVNLCPHQQSYLIIFSMTWQLSQSLTWEARRRKKSEGREHGMWACQCIGLGVPAEPWDAEISLSGLYWERSEWAHQYSLTCSG